MRKRSWKLLRLSLSLFLLSVGTALFAPTALPSQVQQREHTDEKGVEAMRRMFASLHCTEQAPEAMRAFAGCWKVAAVWANPTDENFKLGMRISDGHMQLFIDSYSTQQLVDATNPRYCALEGHPTVAPYPDADFSQEYTYAYVLADLPLNQIEKEATERLSGLSETEKVLVMKRLELAREFVRHGGKIVGTLIIFGPEAVVFDEDGEEDFWALPSTCDGWGDVEERIKEEIKDVKSFRSFGGSMRPSKQ